MIVIIGTETCGSPVTTQVILTGQAWLGVVAIVAALPWLLTAIWSSHRVRLLLCAGSRPPPRCS